MKCINLICGLFLVLCARNTSANTEKLIFQVNQNIPACSFETRSIFGETIQPNSVLIPPFTTLVDTIKTIHPSNSSVVSSHRLYQLAGLTRGSNYELRLSYPAILMSGCDEHLAESLSDDFTVNYWVVVTGTHTGVSTIQDTTTIEPVVYNLVLEKLYGGFLFYNVYKIVFLIAGLLALGSWVVVPAIERIVKP
ncbi:hypothetical protein PHYBLDRAFT_61391 [Phycomyces blakesleeanus NRRL 1555(-)]|uniref:Uncharacterized protein n=1 Tax=Phycomyces blakesleeanus (strain ATCC 8743b / DSM 1359 / FGSC 10004 / NBRC 33097 / NRRL 1555) TaxID=763407 RepID=A0A167QVH4_PHYB8|nr:hypothetical protein PHYBLDRAFT_61391 [Phycomyces blakesleeanus NRRL 1555(-)]OAD80340.1 hypothetical protein PHYBLDRAFT_61391 [Phycomyces blakesleeanus NRRL 1555(-)]|eukprot:XP_018298380.1 hypothetical protein PHYBLDRAFT_61391 [Phycomyces blakesleeanus NRRL 1555(-)]